MPVIPVMWRLGGLWFEARLGKKFTRPHFNQYIIECGGAHLLSQPHEGLQA
jgi:hypothetical protein